MADIPLSLGAYKRSGFSEIVTLNCVSEKAPSQVATSDALIARPGLSAFATVGTGPIRGVFKRDGVFGGDTLVVSSTTLYRVNDSGTATAFSGTVAGDADVTIDAGQNADLEDIARIATGSALYQATGTTVAAEDFPTTGGAGASSVCFHRMYFFATEAGTDKVWYRSSTDTSWSALSFISAEYNPDRVQAIRNLGDLFVLLGSATTEYWALSGTASPAIQPVSGLNFKYGCRSGLSAVVVGSSLLWVDDACAVRQSEGSDARIISDPGLSEQIAREAADDLVAGGFQYRGHFYYVLRLSGSATWVYDLSAQRWSRFSTQGYDYWTAKLFCSTGSQVIAADALSADLYLIDGDALTDAGTEFAMEFMAVDEVAEGLIPVHNVELVCQTGDSPRSGQGSDPIVRMRFKDSDQRGWSNWIDKSLGLSGENPRVVFRRLGEMRGPSQRLYHFQISDPVGRRVTALKRNTGNR